MLDTDYKTYSISYIERDTEAFLTLAGKEDNLTEDLRMKFRDFATSVGVTGDLIDLVRTESC
ncbi:hypothetical protein E2320_006574 [Naja naja]|nr:hypothetical protein E2320_006574 [Naja naja]